MKQGLSHNSSLAYNYYTTASILYTTTPTTTTTIRLYVKLEDVKSAGCDLCRGWKRHLNWSGLTKFNLYSLNTNS